jgi:hypothetical protein
MAYRLFSKQFREALPVVYPEILLSATIILT